MDGFTSGIWAMTGNKMVDLAELKKVLACLVPRPSSIQVVTSHELSVCDCLVIELIDRIEALEEENKKLGKVYKKEST